MKRAGLLDGCGTSAAKLEPLVKAQQGLFGQGPRLVRRLFFIPVRVPD